MPPVTENDASTPTSPLEDSRLPLLAAVRNGCWGLLAVLVLSLIGWGVGVGMPGVWGALIGGLIGGGCVLLTALSVVLTARSAPTTTAAVILGGWLLKIVLVLLVLAALKGMDFYHHWALFLTTVLSLLVVLGAEVWGVTRTTVLYVS
ncbi:hypothetical protein L1O03_07160 [Corynebacterium uropygiale]|uniref:ATP synthase protein I n=1 Tax=Corynebacterium uropygiale TaxID=1775911 RepID=A0A9X1QPV5_9CORY|nr:hypothetical protein [Corynebacterium uropygiale]MCF4006956.1 hypothetical protein [Corynebacterium uropygiale]